MRPVEASRLIWKNANVKGNELLVFQVLASFANRNFECCPGTQTLAQMTNLSRRHVIRVLHSLRAKGLIAFDHNPGGKGKTHHFRLLVNGDNGDISGTRKGDSSKPQRGTKPHGKGDTALAPSVEDLEAELDAISPQDLSAAMEKSAAISGTFHCEFHGPFKRQGFRFGRWLVWRGYEEIYGGGWSLDAGCAECRNQREALRTRPNLCAPKFELEAPALCPVHGQILVRAHVVSSSLYPDYLSISTDLCEACDSEWQGQVWVQEQLGLSPEQWNRPGVGDQILDALRRAECQQGGEQ